VLDSDGIVFVTRQQNVNCIHEIVKTQFTIRVHTTALNNHDSR